MRPVAGLLPVEREQQHPSPAHPYAALRHSVAGVGVTVERNDGAILTAR
jgi:hypothetical protein